VANKKSPEAQAALRVRFGRVIDQFVGGGPLLELSAIAYPKTRPYGAAIAQLGQTDFQQLTDSDSELGKRQVLFERWQRRGRKTAARAIRAVAWRRKVWGACGYLCRKTKYAEMQSKQRGQHRSASGIFGIINSASRCGFREEQDRNQRS